MSTPSNPELTAAIIRAAMIEAVFIVVGVCLYFQLKSIWALVVPVVAGAGVFLFFLAQAGGFSRSNDQR